MKSLKERLEEKIEKDATLRSMKQCSTGQDDLNKAISWYLKVGFEAGAASLLPLVVELHSALEFYGSTTNWTSLSTKIEYDVFAEDDLKHVVIGEDEQGVIAVKMAGAKASQALQSIEKFLEGE